MWGSGFDINVHDDLVLDVPVELGLPLVPTIRAHRMGSEREIVDHIVYEVDRALLVVPTSRSCSKEGCLAKS